MHFEIRSALMPGKQLTPRQRKSGFSECPTLAGKTLRRGVVLTLTSEQMDINKLQIKKLVESESIVVKQLGEAVSDVPNPVVAGEGNVPRDDVRAEGADSAEGNMEVEPATTEETAFIEPTEPAAEDASETFLSETKAPKRKKTK